MTGSDKESEGNAFKNGSSNFLKIFLAKPQILATIATFSDAGWSSLVARRAHNPKVVGSNPAPATEFPFRVSSVCLLNLFSLKFSLYLSVISFCAAAIPSLSFPWPSSPSSRHNLSGLLHGQTDCFPISKRKTNEVKQALLAALPLQEKHKNDEPPKKDSVLQSRKRRDKKTGTKRHRQKSFNTKEHGIN